MRFGILGSGSWGTALVKILTDNQHTVNWWIRNKEIIDHSGKKNIIPNTLVQSTLISTALI